MTRTVGLLGVFRRKRGQNQFAQDFAGFAVADVSADASVFRLVKANVVFIDASFVRGFRLATRAALNLAFYNGDSLVEFLAKFRRRAFFLRFQKRDKFAGMRIDSIIFVHWLRLLGFLFFRG